MIVVQHVKGETINLFYFGSLIVLLHLFFFFCRGRGDVKELYIPHFSSFYGRLTQLKFIRKSGLGMMGYNVFKSGGDN